MTGSEDRPFGSRNLSAEPMVPEMTKLQRSWVSIRSRFCKKGRRSCRPTPWANRARCGWFTAT